MGGWGGGVFVVFFASCGVFAKDTRLSCYSLQKKRKERKGRKERWGLWKTKWNREVLLPAFGTFSFCAVPLTRRCHVYLSTRTSSVKSPHLLPSCLSLSPLQCVSLNIYTVVHLVHICLFRFISESLAFVGAPYTSLFSPASKHKIKQNTNCQSCQNCYFHVSTQKKVLQYRKAVTNFQAAAADRANTQVESSLQMELLSRISGSKRGLASTRKDRAAILGLIERLEGVQAPSANGASPAAAAPRRRGRGRADGGGGSGDKLAAAAEAAAEAARDASAAATAMDALIEDEESLEGQWHLEYVSSSEEGASGWDFTDSTGPEKTDRVSREGRPKQNRRVLVEAASQAARQPSVCQQYRCKGRTQHVP